MGHRQIKLLMRLLRSCKYLVFRLDSHVRHDRLFRLCIRGFITVPVPVGVSAARSVSFGFCDPSHPP